METQNSIAMPSTMGRAFRQALASIRSIALSGDYSPGDKIPSERVLAEQLHLSRMTVRKAIDHLVSQGVLERRSTSGTHVSSPRIMRPLDPNTVIGIPQIIKNSGGNPGSRLLFFESCLASEHIAEHLQVREGEPLIAIRTLRSSDGVPFCIEKSYLIAAHVPGLAAADLVEGESVYTLLQQRYGIFVQRSKGVVSVAPIKGEDVKLLGMQDGDIALIYRVSVYDQNGAAIEHTISINNPQRALFTTDSNLLFTKASIAAAAE